MQPKYQIFVSSTYEDLKDERDLVIKAVLEMGHIPVGMEMFSAADEEQWQIIARQIDQSDYYVIIIAHRYGSLTPEQISFTEKEYDYAVSQGVPVLGFLQDNENQWPGSLMETDPDKRQLLEKFKAKVMRKPVNFWTEGAKLYGKVSISLSKTFNTQPRPGWVRATHAMSPETANEIARLSQENAMLRKKSETAQAETLQRLALAAEYRDDDTGFHTKRIATTAKHIAQALGMPPSQVELIERAAPLHDVGKIGISDLVLLKPNRLTDEELAHLKQHPVVGAALLSGSTSPWLQMAEEIALTHHERWDGSGYPQGLSGEDIPIAGRIVAVADIFDALTHARPYKSAWSVAEAVKEIERQSGKQLDEKVVEAFLTLPHETLI